MNSSDRINAFIQLGERLAALTIEEKQHIATQAGIKNRWFDFANIDFAISRLSIMLSREELHGWCTRYSLNTEHPKKIGVVMAGNIPLVGFHDALSVLITGHHLMAKLSQDDQTLMLFVFEQLLEIEPRFAGKISLVERINDADAVIATGSDNTAKHFEYYFASKPHLIRRNRVGVAVISGQESDDDFKGLGSDIFRYYGLGCRNISKIYIPQDFELRRFFEAIEEWRPVIDHHKYNNNYEYNRAVYLLKNITHLDNGFLVVVETTDLISPIAILFYERYTDPQAVQDDLNKQSHKIQCVVADSSFWPGAIPFGKAQMPHLWDYADGIDTMKFLTQFCQ